MRFIIYGAGGVGGVIGAQLFKGGEDVVLIARGAHLAALQSEGLRYETPFDDVRLPIPAVGHPGEISPGSDDVFVLTCKSQHTLTVLEDLRATHGDRVPVVCCQNGVANERMAQRRFSDVYAMLVYLPAQLLEPGRIQCHAKLKSGVLDVGIYPGGTDDRCEGIARRFSSVNLSVKPDPAVMRLKYQKLLVNLNNALEAITPPSDERQAVLREMKAEARACFEAAGIDCASDDEAAARRAGVLAMGEIPGVDRQGGSSRQSLLRATGDIEADYLNGEITGLGRQWSVPTPANVVVQRLSVELARAKGAPGSIAINEVRALIEAERLRG